MSIRGAQHKQLLTHAGHIHPAIGGANTLARDKSGSGTNRSLSPAIKSSISLNLKSDILRKLLRNRNYPGTRPSMLYVLSTLSKAVSLWKGEGHKPEINDLQVRPRPGRIIRNFYQAKH